MRSMWTAILLCIMGCTFTGCRTPDSETPSSDIKKGEGPSLSPGVFDFSGNRITCTSHNPTGICPAMTIPVSDEQFSRCDAAGGKIQRCGACGNTIACTRPPARNPVVYNLFGEIAECSELDERGCTTTANAGAFFTASCRVGGGKVKLCGRCGEEARCTRKPVEPIVYDWDTGDRTRCSFPSRDPDTICPAIAVTVSPERVEACKKAEGSILFCGACGHFPGCTQNPVFKKSYNIYGDLTECFRQRDCEALDDYEKKLAEISCYASDGGFSYCGCRPGCNKKPSAPEVYRISDGTSFKCETRRKDWETSCGVRPEISRADEVKCWRKWGEVVRCGPCGKTFGCTEKP